MTRTLARIVKPSAAFAGSNVVRAGIAFGLSLALARGLGADRFGRWIRCTTWASPLTVAADLGLGVLLARDGARPDVDAAAAWRLVSGSLLLRLALVVPLAAIVFACAPILGMEPESVSGIRLASILGVVSAAYGCFGSLFRSRPQWLPAILGVETGWLAVQLAGSWWLVQSGATVAALVTLAIAVQAAQMVSALVLWRPVFGRASHRATPSIEGLTTLFRRALPFAATGVVANLEARIAPLMLGYLATSPALGLFAAAARVGRVARLIPSALFAGTLPVLSREHGHDHAAAGQTFRAFDKMMLALAVASCGACALFAAPIVRLVYGPSFAAAAPALVWIGAGLAPTLSNSARKLLLYAGGREAVVLRWTLIGVVVQAACALPLIAMFGATGAAASVAIGEGAIWLPLRRAAPEPRGAEPQLAPAVLA